MVNAVNRENVVFLGSDFYPIRGQVRRGRIPRFPSKILTGPEEYRNESVLDHLIIHDQRGGILIGEMDESVHADRCWWTNLNIDYEGHMPLPRLATSLTYSQLATINSTTDDSSDWATTGYAYNNDLATASTSGSATGATGYLEFNITSATINGIMLYASTSAGTMTYDLDVYYASDWHNVVTTGAITNNTWTAVDVDSATGATAFQVRFTRSESAIVSINEVDINVQGTTISDVHFCDFNSELYCGWYDGTDSWVTKLNAAGDRFLLIGAITDGKIAGEHITDLVSSLNDCMYIGLGDTTSYQYMTTAEVIASANVASYWFIQWNALLFRFLTTGTCESSPDPNGGTPTYTTRGSVTDQTSAAMQHPYIGPDADGDDIIYWPTIGPLKAHDYTNAKWLNTRIKLTGSPNAGKAVYWRDSAFLAEGLGVKKYVTGSTATVTSMGLDRDAGLPVEYNGEIVKLIGGGENEMFALVDSSYPAGTPTSGLYAYDGQGWRCWWIDTSTDGKMHDGIVSAAESQYGFYFDCRNSVYRINIPRGVRNPKQLPATLKYGAAGVWIMGWMTGGTIVFEKVVKSIVSWCKAVSANETVTISYRTDHTNTNLATGWTSLVVLNSTGENDDVETKFNSNQGTVFNSFQVRLDLARGSTNTSSPDVQALSIDYRRLGFHNTWTVEIDPGEAELVSSTPKTLFDALLADAASSIFLEFTFRDSNADSTQTHYVYVHPASIRGVMETGANWDSRWFLTLVEV